MDSHGVLAKMLVGVRGRGRRRRARVDGKNCKFQVTADAAACTSADTAEV